MVEITSIYVGNLFVENHHGPSSSSIKTIPPVDNGGTGELFSPTDLVATALGSCMLTIMGVVAERNNIPFKGVSVKVEKHMNQSPRRIGKLVAHFQMKSSFNQEERLKLELAAKKCPVKESLHKDIEIILNFNYDD